MGQQAISCGCLEGVLSEGNRSKDVKDRLAKLQEGSKFMKSAYLGLSSKEINMKLSADVSKLEWKTVASSFLSPEEFGEIDLTTQVKTLKLQGAQGLQIISTVEENRVSKLAIFSFSNCLISYCF